MRRARHLLATVGLTAVIALSAQADETLRPDDFAAQFRLANVADGLNAVELTEAVYRAATQRSLRDLRVFNAQGEPLPFAVLPPAPPAPPAVREVELGFAALPAQRAAHDAALQAYALRFERDRDRAVLEIKGEAPATGAASADVGGYLIDARSLKDTKGRLRLQFGPDAPDFAGRVDVLGSEDLVNWRALVHGPLARERRLGETIEKNRFELNDPPSFLRVAWSGTTAPRITGARFEALTPVADALPRAPLATSVGNDGRSLYAELPPALPTERLYIRMPQVNMSERFSVYRHVADPAPRSRHLGRLPRRAPEHWVPAGALNAFRVMRGGIEVEGAPLAFNVPTDGVRIDAARTLTGALPTVEAEWRPARIAFAARAPGPYRLAAGHPGAPASPSLDLPAVLPADDAAGMTLPVARIEPSAAYTADPGNARAERIAAQARGPRTVLWIVLGLAVLGLAWMAWRLAVQLRAASARSRADVRR